MKTVILDVQSLDESLNDFVYAMETGEASEPRISFASVDLLFKTLGGRRLELLHVLTSAGPVTIREAARRVSRDVRAVHADIHTLLNAGVLEKTDDGLVVFPYDALHVDFMLRAAA